MPSAVRWIPFVFFCRSRFTGNDCSFLCTSPASRSKLTQEHRFSSSFLGNTCLPNPVYPNITHPKRDNKPLRLPLPAFRAFVKLSARIDTEPRWRISLSFILFLSITGFCSGSHTALWMKKAPIEDRKSCSYGGYVEATRVFRRYGSAIFWILPFSSR